MSPSSASNVNINAMPTRIIVSLVMPRAPGGRNTKSLPGPKEFYTAVGPAWGWAQNAPFRRYKQWVHEGGISTPLIARWPNTIQPNSKTAQVGHLIDFMATFVDMAEANGRTGHKCRLQAGAAFRLDQRDIGAIGHIARHARRKTSAAHGHHDVIRHAAQIALDLDHD